MDTFVSPNPDSTTSYSKSVVSDSNYSVEYKYNNASSVSLEGEMAGGEKSNPLYNCVTASNGDSILKQASCGGDYSSSSDGELIPGQEYGQAAESSSDEEEETDKVGNDDNIAGDNEVVEEDSVRFDDDEEANGNDESVNFVDSEAGVSERIKSSRRLQRPDSLSIDRSSSEPKVRSRGRSRRRSSYRSNVRTYFYIQMELCQRETLQVWLRKNENRCKKLVLKFFSDIVNAVEHMHDLHIMHRDLKVGVYLLCEIVM